MSTTTLATTTPNTVAGLTVDREAILRSLKLDPRDPNVQALVLVCQQYGLDPLLRHMVLIQGQPYVTARGLWHIAHRSGLLDGWEVLEQGETSTEWWARVQMRRKDMAGPWVMTGRYAKSGGNKAHGPEMAVTRAEVHILRRMFDVSATAVEEMDFDRAGRPQAQPVEDDDDPLVSEQWRRWWFTLAKKHGADNDAARRAIVHTATNGRTEHLAEVRASEKDAVKAATEAWATFDEQLDVADADVQADDDAGAPF